MVYVKVLAILSSIALLLAIPPVWPYSYYQLLRVFIFLSGGLIALAALNLQKNNWVFVMVVLAILFNPFKPIHLEKQVWIVIDFVSAFIFLGSISIFKQRNLVDASER